MPLPSIINNVLLLLDVLSLLVGLSTDDEKSGILYNEVEDAWQLSRAQPNGTRLEMCRDSIHFLPLGWCCVAYVCAYVIHIRPRCVLCV